MIKALLLALSFETLLSYLDAKDVRRSIAEPYGHQQRSVMSLLLQRAKNKNNNAIKALNKTNCYQEMQTKLQLVTQSIDEVNTTSAASTPIGLRNALREETDALKGMLSVYKRENLEEKSEGNPCKSKLLNAIYRVVRACFILMKALTDLKSDEDLKSYVLTVALPILRHLLARPEDTELLNKVAGLAEEVLTMTESQSGEQQDLPKQDSRTFRCC